MAAKGSAVADSNEPIEVLFALHEKFNLLDFAGPLEALTSALHDKNDPDSKAFEVTIAAAEPKVLSGQGAIIGSQISFKEAHERLTDFDVVVVLGGNHKEIIEKKAEPLDLITKYAAIQEEDPSRERTLLSVCTGSFFLAEKELLIGLSATTHPGSLTEFENVCSRVNQRVNAGEYRTDIIDDARYVVNNLRFDIGNEDENPYIRKKSDGRRPSAGGRKGSISFKDSGRRDSISRRKDMVLGGLRVITSGGITAGIDAALYLISAMVSDESAEHVADFLQWTWTKGIVVDGLDV